MRKARAKLNQLSRWSPTAGGRLSFSLGDTTGLPTPPGGGTVLSDPGGGRPAATDDGDKPIDFGKFFLAQEGGGVIPWSQFLLLAPDEARTLTEKTTGTRRAECERAFEETRQAWIEKRKARAAASTVVV